jgi:polyhydroxyalkanoate synthase
MTEQQANQAQLSKLWKLWAESPGTQSWLFMQKTLWAMSPLSRLVPIDTEEMWRAFTQLGEGVTVQPGTFATRTAELLQHYTDLSLWALQRYLTPEATASAAPPADKQDRGFEDDAWSNDPLFSTIKQSYMILSNWLLSLAKETQGLDPKTQRRVNFYVHQFVDATSPANFLWTNPVALRETLESGGENLRRGMENLIRDMKRGEVSTSGRQHFKLGENMAMTPGQVVFRNELIELIQYNPTTPQVHQVPLLIIPPWINKYYILDLRPGRSMIEHLASQGVTVFLISWRNPDASMQRLRMDDYVRSGPLAAMQVTKSITGSSKVNLLGYCIGGTMLSLVLSYLKAIGDETPNTGTFFTALQDFSEVGDTAVFISEEMLDQIEKWIHPKGYIDGPEMNSIFKLMRANELIWNFVVSNYLLGKEPPDFDLLYWSSDGVRMPRDFHSEYLRNCYLENNLVKPDRVRVLGEGIDLRRVSVPCYVVAGSEDHIVPWRAAHRARALFSGPTRLILGNGGHIGAVINPPASGKGSYFTNESDTTDPEGWLKTAERHKGSWWPDWCSWLSQYSGAMVAPPTVGNADYPPLMQAPGTYVMPD